MDHSILYNYGADMVVYSVFDELDLYHEFHHLVSDFLSPPTGLRPRVFPSTDSLQKTLNFRRTGLDRQLVHPLSFSKLLHTPASRAAAERAADRLVSRHTGWRLETGVGQLPGRIPERN